MNITSIELENFKCFTKTQIDFGNITLLTGANSSGKSSLISALLTVFQTDEFPHYLSPNGKYISLGNFRNMVNGYDISKNIEINFNIEGRHRLFKVDTSWKNNPINGLPIVEFVDFFDDQTAESLWEFSQCVSFNFIHSFRKNPQRNYLQIPKAREIEPDGSGFENQIIEWEENNSPKINELVSILKNLGLVQGIKTNKIGDGMFDMKIQTKPNGLYSSIADVGYGVSKLLPIIVADLQLSDNSLLVISEPEIDLHPSIQANFANYLFEQTKKGKRYIIETHSEYIINRLRLLIAKNEMKEEDVKTYFFVNDGHNTSTYPIVLKKDGQIQNAPQDFFDTYEVDVLEIAMQ